MTPSDGTPPLPPSPDKVSPVVVLLVLALLACGGYELNKYWPKSVTAKAVIVRVNGDTAPISGVVVLSSKGSVATQTRWTTDIPVTQIPLPDSDYFAFAGPTTSRDVKVTLLAVKADTLAETSLVVTPGGSPTPLPVPPTPLPVPPTPLPVPPDNPDIDPELRRLAAAYYAGSSESYAGASATIAATSATYDDVTKSIIAKNRQLATAMGSRIDALLKPMYDPSSLLFTDKLVAGRLYRAIADALAAGRADASR